MVGEQLAIKAAETASENLVEIEGNVFRVVKQGRKKVLVPVKVKVGINPLNLLLGVGAGILGGAVGLWALGLGVKILSPDEKAELESQLAREEEGLTNLEADLAKRQAENTCVTTEVFDPGGARIMLTTDHCAELLVIIKDFKARIMGLKARLRIPFSIVERPRFSISLPGLF